MILEIVEIGTLDNGGVLMSIKKSSSWKENGQLEDLEDDYEFNEPSTKSLEDEEVGSREYVYDNREEVYSDEKFPPLFSTNFYLDDEMYEGYKSEGSSKLQYLSSTSEKEDKIYVKLSLTFMLTLLLCGVASFFIDKETKGLNSISIWTSIAVTMTHWFILKKNKIIQ